MTAACVRAIAAACIRRPLRRFQKNRYLSNGKQLCNKSVYYTKAIAEAALAIYRTRPTFQSYPETQAYYCRYGCCGWHLGRKKNPA